MALRTDQARALLENFCSDDAGRSVALQSTATGGLAVRGDTARPAASVIKVAIVMALFDAARQGRIDLEESVSVGSLGDTRYCSILRAFDENRALSLRELAALSLITSDNPATVEVMSRVSNADISAVFEASGCGAAARCGAGFSEQELGEVNRANQMTAWDAVRLFEQLRRIPQYRPIEVFLENNLRNARIPALLPDDAVVAHKTGSLDGVVNDAGCVRRGADSFVIAFLCDEQLDPIATQNDIAACTSALFDVLIN